MRVKPSDFHIYFRIPFTWYWIARVAPFDFIIERKRLFCIATKKWDGEMYYWDFLV